MDASHITALVSVVGTICTALLASYIPHLTAKKDQETKLKMLKAELFEKRRLDAIQSYAKCTGSYLMNPQYSGQYDYQKSRAEVLLFVSKSTRKKIRDIDSYITEKDFVEARKLFSSVIDALSEECGKIEL